MIIDYWDKVHEWVFYDCLLTPYISLTVDAFNNFIIHGFKAPCAIVWGYFTISMKSHTYKDLLLNDVVFCVLFGM